MNLNSDVTESQPEARDDGAGRDLPLVSEPAAEPRAEARGPLAGSPGHDRFYATRLRQLAHLDLDETQAAELWQLVARHRRMLFRRLGRDVGQRVALLDYIVNVSPRLAEPQIIDKAALDAIEHRAVADSLTGLYNRHYFESELTREAERSRRYGMSASLMLLDLDRFKYINDRHGHPIGDRVLQAVGSLILKHVRAADVPCRFGGDEFGVILPDTLRQDAVMVAERICDDIARWFRENLVGGLSLGVTASFGIGSPAPALATYDRLFREADLAMYDAKRQGGNRVSEWVGDTMPDAPPPELR